MTIISTAISGDLMKSAGTQMRIERTLRRQRDEQGIHGFTQVVMSEHVETALDSLLQTAGLGGLGPNTAIAAWPDRWRESPNPNPNPNPNPHPHPHPNPNPNHHPHPNCDLTLPEPGCR